jgi:hypothetical protein
MTDYYKILELQPGASAAEIKKAYFTLVRKYPPEKDPDMFRQIRDAYEQLRRQDENKEEQKPAFAPPGEQIVAQALEHVQLLMSRGQYASAADTCEEVLRVFPKEVQFLYLLELCQRDCGRTGKAVKTGERLVNADPGNMWFWRELAISCTERGYSKKAMSAYQKAYQLGCHDVEFILYYSVQCAENGDFALGARLLFDLVRRDTRWKREQLDAIIEAYRGIISMSLMGKLDLGSEILESLLAFMQKYSIYLEEHFDDLRKLISIAVDGNDLDPDPKSIDLLEEMIGVLEKSCRREANLDDVRSMKSYCRLYRLEHDERLGEEFYTYALSASDPNTDDEGLDKYSILDAKLCMIERREEVLEEFKILKEDYPEFYQYLCEFEAVLMDEKRAQRQKIVLLRQFEYLSERYDGARYFEKYPGERTKNRETILFDSNNEMPYVRETKKVGRNDPCPCGSGKKYKHCCGR